MKYRILLPLIFVLLVIGTLMYNRVVVLSDMDSGWDPDLYEMTGAATMEKPHYGSLELPKDWQICIDCHQIILDKEREYNRLAKDYVNHLKADFLTNIIWGIQNNHYLTKAARDCLQCHEVIR